MKKLLSLLLSVVMIFSALSVLASSDISVDISVTLNGKELSLSHQPLLRGGDIFLPLRDISAVLGYDTEWDNESRSAVMTSQSDKAEVFIGECEVKKNGISSTVGKAPFIENDITYVSADSLFILGASAVCDGDSVALTVDPLGDKYFKIIQTSTGNALSLENGSLRDGAMTVMEPAAQSDIQLWRLSPGGDGLYQPLNKKSGRSFDIPNGNKTPGVTLIQYGVTLGDHQFIRPLQNEDGTYLLQFKHSDLYLTVREDGYLSQEELRADDTQIFTLEEVSSCERNTLSGNVTELMRSGTVFPGERNTLGGKYYSISQTSTGNALSVDKASLEKSAAVTVEPTSDSNSQIWLLTDQGSGSYCVTNKHSSLLLNAGTGVIQYTATYKPEQVFDFIESENGSYLIRSSASGLYLTVSGGRVVQSALSGGEDQLFTLSSPVRSAESYGEDPLGGKNYVITNLLNKKVVSVESASPDNSARILTEEASGSDSQIWTFVTCGGGMYIITNKKSGRSFDIPSASTAPGAWLTQYATNYGNNQIFELIENSDGSYMFKNKNSGLYLTVRNGYLVQAKPANNALQRFSLTEVGKSDAKMIGAAATLFVLKGEEKVTNAHLQWNSVNGATAYDIYKRADEGDFEFFTSLTGTSLDDYDLEIGKSYSYRVYALDGENLIDYVETEIVKPYPLPSDLKSSSNLEESSLVRPNSLCVDGVYYNFSSWGREDGNGFGRLMMRTSEDDITYGEWTEVLNYEEILANETCSNFSSCRFESQNFIYNSATNKFVFIAHFEADGGYGTAMTSFASATPGERFTFHRAIRPEGGDTRDLNVYVDDDNKAYLIAAINVNADLALYELTEDWTDVKRLVCIVNKNSWRELPSMLKADGIYYLFSSGTAGWYPTQGMYNTAASIDGPWSPLRPVGNTTTFSSQSGTVFRLRDDSTNYIMSTYRWMYFWNDAIVKRTTNRRYPVKVSNGYAFYDFFDELLYNWDNDDLVPVQNGRLLSQGKPSKTTPSAGEAKYINDGDYRTYWYGGGKEKWPFTWEVDLGQAYSLTSLQISWLIWNGSEPYYSYKLEGSVDGKTYTALLDKTEGFTDYGFTIDQLSGTARYVRLTVTDAKPRNSDTNNYPAQLYEVKVFGN